jgi:hypothetical protein
MATGKKKYKPSYASLQAQIVYLEDANRDMRLFIEAMRRTVPQTVRMVEGRLFNNRGKQCKKP